MLYFGELMAGDVWGCNHAHLGSRGSTGKGMCDCFVSLSGSRRRQILGELRKDAWKAITCRLRDGDGTQTAKAWCGVVFGVDDVGARGIWREANRG
ncbi:uncharacterized protein MONOS_17156 [Monocercomonoides exilis]|uniref:uncharacterized protein n=1 Tax=Monocercomonoides exilis TaxID=2049356 RepID=UPI00355A4AC7|nr:hypothetical protein MONOS_17156 [Monocercomonoides exilis]